MMDWNALGTWAAVVVALGISLRETLERRRQRTARHLVMSAKILPDVLRLRQALTETIYEARQIGADADLITLRDASDSFAARLNGMGLGHLQGQADEVDALPEPMLIPLVKAIALSGMLLENHGLRRALDEPSSEWGAREELSEWQEQAYAIKIALDWVAQGASSQMNSSRWKNPERWI